MIQYARKSPLRAAKSRAIKRGATVRVPTQRRSRESHEHLIASAERLLAKGGATKFTLAAVSHNSGVSVGGIYRRFKSRETLIQAVQERMNARMELEFQELEAEVAAKTHCLEARVRMLVSSLADLLSRHAPILKAIVEASWFDPIVAARGREAFHVHQERFVLLLLEHRKAMSHEDPEHAAHFCFNSVYELVASHYGVGGRISSDRERWPALVKDLQRLFVAFFMMPVSIASDKDKRSGVRLRRGAASGK